MKWTASIKPYPARVTIKANTPIRPEPDLQAPPRLSIGATPYTATVAGYIEDGELYAGSQKWWVYFLNSGGPVTFPDAMREGEPLAIAAAAETERDAAVDAYRALVRDVTRWVTNDSAQATNRLTHLDKVK